MTRMPSALIVDDHEENLYLLRALLAGSGYEVRAADNGAEALVSARAAPPDVIISDILMPVMDGFTLCRECKGDPSLARIPFVFYTATYTDPRDEELALSLGADLFLIKPTEPDAFAAAIAQVLRRCRTEGSTKPQAPPLAEANYLKQYNETLVRKLEDKLQQLEEAHRALALRGRVIDASVSGIALAGEDGCCTYANPSFARLWGVARDDLRGRPLLALVADERTRTGIERALASGQSWVGEIHTRRVDGTTLILHALVERVADAACDSSCLMVSCADVSDRARMQAELQRTARLESLNVLSRSVAHDFNNLLMGMLGNVELGMRVLPEGSPALKYLQVAVAVYERARHLTQRLQAFAKDGPTSKKCVDLAEIVRECGALSLSGSNVRLEVSADADLRTVEADPNQLSQLFNNLLLNARQAMPDGGTVFVSLRNRPGAGRDAAADDDWVEVSVRDEGPGVSEEVAPLVFDPFFTTKPGGSGLGLATACWIVKDHGGEIRLAPPAGRGATFVVLLPARSGEVAAPAPPAGDLSGQGRILLMDDEALVRDTVRRMLSLVGYEVTAVADGAEAEAAYQHASAENRPFDLTILDLTIRGGVSGLETLRRLRAIHPDSAVMLSSGYHDDGLVARAAALGSVGFIQKPYLRHELLSRVKAAIGAPKLT